jgi:ribonuclease P protein component
MSLPAQFRCLCAADFQRVMRTRPLGRSSHFMLHFLPAVDNLSTARQLQDQVAVDDAASSRHSAPRLGFVLPKRMVKRAVTRALIRHQARDMWFKLIVQPEQPDMPPPSSLPVASAAPRGDWVLRVVSPWAKTEFPSAASEPLKQAIRHELTTLLQSCRQRLHA